jgi:hypothetical protein
VRDERRLLREAVREQRLPRYVRPERRLVHDDRRLLLRHPVRRPRRSIEGHVHAGRASARRRHDPVRALRSELHDALVLRQRPVHRRYLPLQLSGPA